ncbi:MAG: hypothetical protein CMN30_00955 [Sandaracinus sp.]|nr:hypothetical protein [Sandaracinus sp.]
MGRRFGGPFWSTGRHPSRGGLRGSARVLDTLGEPPERTPDPLLHKASFARTTLRRFRSAASWSYSARSRRPFTIS